MRLKDIQVHRVLKFNCAPDWHWEKQADHSWPSAPYRSHGDKYFWNNNLWSILSGKGILRTRQKHWPLHRGDVFLLRGNETYLSTHDPNNPLVVIAIHFDYLDDNRITMAPEKIPFHHYINQMHFFESLLERLENSWRSGQTDQVGTWMKACLAEIMNASTEKVSAPESRQEKTIKSLCEEFRNNPARPYTLSELARQTHCSPRHFNRLFRKYMGVTPQQYILTLRLETAKDLLLSSSLSVGRIAELTGISDIYYFSKWFKAQTGHPPSKYRKT